MNKQRKVLITITYNEMGIIIDTKAEEVTQPNLQPTCNQLAKDISVPCKDTISRRDAIDALDTIESEVADGEGFRYAKWREYFENLPPSQPEQPKRGRWIKHEDRAGWCCSECAIDDYYAYCLNSDTGVYELQDKFCYNCGADMRGEQDE